MKGDIKEKDMFEEVLLPNGRVACSKQEVDDFLKKNNLAAYGDFSGEYLKNVRRKIFKQERDDAFADFILTYKKRIWNE